MRRELLFGTVFAAAMAVGLSAQTGTSQANDQTSGKTVTVTGCLQPSSGSGGAGMTGATGTSGSTATTPESGSAKYQLTNASVSSGAAGAETATGTSGSTADTSMSGTKTFDLKASSSDKEDTWSKYVNHKVQVRGTLNDNGGQGAYSSGGSAAGTTGSTASSSASGAQSSASSAGAIQVDSITDLGSCSGH